MFPSILYAIRGKGNVQSFTPKNQPFLVHYEFTPSITVYEFPMKIYYAIAALFQVPGFPLFYLMQVKKFYIILHDMF